MSRAATAFRQNDITRALRAATAGREVRRVEVDRDGKIVLVLIEQQSADPESDGSDIVL
jgi:hypothetical protein